MARIGVFAEAPRQWFAFDVDTEIQLEFISRDRMNKLINQAESIARKVGGSKSEIYDAVLGKAAVHGWRKQDKHDHPGLLLPNGSPIPFTEENRTMLMRSCGEFSNFVYRNCTDAENFLEEPEVRDQKSLDQLLAEIDFEDDGGKNG